LYSDSIFYFCIKCNGLSKNANELLLIPNISSNRLGFGHSLKSPIFLSLEYKIQVLSIFLIQKTHKF